MKASERMTRDPTEVVLDSAMGQGRRVGGISDAMCLPPLCLPWTPFSVERSALQQTTVPNRRRLLCSD